MDLQYKVAAVAAAAALALSGCSGDDSEKAGTTPTGAVASGAVDGDVERGKSDLTTQGARIEVMGNKAFFVGTITNPGKRDVKLTTVSVQSFSTSAVGTLKGDKLTPISGGLGVKAGASRELRTTGDVAMVQYPSATVKAGTKLRVVMNFSDLTKATTMATLGQDISPKK